MRLTIEQFKMTGIELNDYQERSVSAAEKLAAEISKFWDCYPMIRVSKQDSGNYFDYVNLFLKHPTLVFEISYNWHRSKQYGIYCKSLDDFKDVSHYSKDEARKGLTEPNGIGVLTTKKIQAWVTYYEQVYANLKVINDANSDKKTAFINSLAGLPVKWDRDNKSGSMIKNGIEYSFSIGDTFIDQRIKIHYSVDSSLSAFLGLSDNKFKVTAERAHFVH